MKNNIISKAKRTFQYMLNPGIALNSESKQKWFLFLLMPATAWALFFLQVHISQYKGGEKSLWLMIAAGFLAGYIINMFMGFSLALLLRLMKREVRYGNVIAHISLSHTYKFFSLIIGFIYMLFGTNVSASFGIAGLLCTLMPIYSGIRGLVKGKPFVPPLLATYAGLLMLVCWKAIIWIGG